MPLLSFGCLKNLVSHSKKFSRPEYFCDSEYDLLNMCFFANSLSTIISEMYNSRIFFTKRIQVVSILLVVIRTRSSMISGYISEILSRQNHNNVALEMVP